MKSLFVLLFVLLAGCASYTPSQPSRPTSAADQAFLDSITWENNRRQTCRLIPVGPISNGIVNMDCR